ncbi:MAG: cell division protein ZapB [Isosphaeraceae bacterium]|nr:cell division protein ZapB [Isosphaeraceae bacterium]
MTTGRRTCSILVVAVASIPCLGGCAGQSSFLNSGTATGSLRTSVSHLQYENEQLKRQVADLKSETRNLEDQIVQEEARNGDLTARLDDARHALRGNGADASASSLDPEPVDPPQRTLPAGRSTKKKRKPPFAQIPGRVDEPPPSDVEGAPVKDLRGDASSPQTWRGDGSGWLPVARSPFSLVR